MEQKFECPLGDLLVSDNKQLLDVPFIHGFLSRSYWAENIPLATVKQAIDHSVSFGVYLASRQIGFARVITDRATFPYLAELSLWRNFAGMDFRNV